MRAIRKVTAILALALAGVSPVLAQSAREQYIEKYSDIAVEQMIASGIPASITLAQGILESGCGKSTLATKANNHFGIKCHNWTGDTFYIDDDAPNECFRKYDNVEQSFSDHSDFLRFRVRYRDLFTLEPTDYKGWAQGLQKAGYATNPQYAQLLVGIIEDCGLDKYDRKALGDTVDTPLPVILKEVEKPIPAAPKYTTISLDRDVMQVNGVPYVVTNGLDTWRSLANEFSLSPAELRKFNEYEKNSDIPAGAVIYLERKKAQSAEHLDKHVVDEGDTMHSIAQRYGVRLKCLYKYNNLPKGSNPAVGDIIILRKPNGQKIFKK